MYDIPRIVSFCSVFSIVVFGNEATIAEHKITFIPGRALYMKAKHGGKIKVWIVAGKLQGRFSYHLQSASLFIDVGLDMPEYRLVRSAGNYA